MIEGLQEILYSMGRNKLRTALTAFGVFWGIFMLVLLLGGGQGLQNGIEQGFSSDVRDSLWIRSSRTSVPYKGMGHGRWIQFTESDLRAVGREIEGIDLMSAENQIRTARITYGNRGDSFSVLGVSEDYFKIKRYQEYRLGRRLNLLDNLEQRKVVVIGTRVAERLFPDGRSPISEQVSINGVSFRVVGVFYDSGWEGRMSERLYIPLTTYQNTFGSGEDISLIVMTPQAGYVGSDLEERAVELLKQRHHIAPSDRRAIRVTDLAKQSAQTDSMINAIKFFIWFVGLGTLTAGIVGISNIMIITVKERTVEIGVRKALGAAPLNIVSTILLEAVLVTAIAGYGGLVLAVGILEFINFLLVTFQIELTMFVRPEVDFGVALTALMILVVSGAVAGFFPAWQAAKIAPIEAMRAG